MSIIICLNHGRLGFLSQCAPCVRLCRSSSLQEVMHRSPSMLGQLSETKQLPFLLKAGPGGPGFYAMRRWLVKRMGWGPGAAVAGDDSWEKW